MIIQIKLNIVPYCFIGTNYANSSFFIGDYKFINIFAFVKCNLYFSVLKICIYYNPIQLYFIIWNSCRSKRVGQVGHLLEKLF